VDMKWTGDAAGNALKGRLGANLHFFDEVILNKARELIGVQGPPRSLPGDPPHMDSQRLHDSLYDEVDAGALQSRFGSSEEHAVYMEEGTEDVDARPWLIPAIEASADDAAQELAR
jgi:hypothetical protein